MIRKFQIVNDVSKDQQKNILFNATKQMYYWLSSEITMELNSSSIRVSDIVKEQLYEN